MDTLKKMREDILGNSMGGERERERDGMPKYAKEREELEVCVKRREALEDIP